MREACGRSPAARAIREKVDAHDLGRLLMHRSRLPGADEHVPLVAVSRSEAAMDGVSIISPEELLGAWRH
ncbi:hypothetical protein [Micromonospora sp. NPDC006431]|uniref:hypothetical protein n=1 Tax=Micromonospora sp. NPDC006431 TaxID=3364235 RepID=UPI0036C37990